MNTPRAIQFAWLLIVAGAPGPLCADTAKAGNPPVRVFHRPFVSAIENTGGRVTFARATEASYFDVHADRIVTVPTNTPRFVCTADGEKTWGMPAGILLEGATCNLLLDSSFEGALTNWTFDGEIARRADVGIHGAHGLAVKGPAAINHQPVSVRVYPERCTYYLSLYVRRADGSDMSPQDVVCDSKPVSGPWDSKQNTMLPVARLGTGPWHRVSAVIGNWESQQRSTPPETNAFVHTFRFRAGTYHVDAAQLEWNPSTLNRYWQFFSPSSYVPTADKPAERAQDVMWAPTGALLPGPSWSISFWRYALPPRGNPHGPVFGLWDETGGAPKPVLTVCREYAAGVFIGQDREPGWDFITLTRDGARMDVFVNGVSRHDGNGPFEFELPASLPEKAYWAGPWRSDLYAPMGMIADFSTWNRALTAEEVAGLHASGSPVVQPASRFPIAFALDRPGKVSINAYDSDGRLAHQVVIAKMYEAGEHTVDWDGCDRDGQPVPLGAYAFKGIVHNVRSVYDGKICNTSPSPGGEWKQYRTGHYYDVAALPDGGIATVSAWGEHGRVVQVIDGPPDYPVRWSANVGCHGASVAVAADSNHVYTVTSHWQDNHTLARDSLFRWDTRTGAKVPFAARDGIEISPLGSLWLNAVRPKEGGWSLATGAGVRTNPFANVGVHGIAARNGRIYVALHDESRIATLDAVTGVELASTPCDAPRKIALDRDGNWFVTGSNGVVRIGADGSTAQAVTNLTNPSGVALGPDGTLYVTELEPLHQGRVYTGTSAKSDLSDTSDKESRLLRVFGQKGGHQGGRIAPDTLDNPLGISVAGDGTILLSDLG
ncbi:MAG: FlgD immunoglobulin-like domain containing protein, partial [Kiritimatiellae bacterium]|nr:FlgD immunoglobulin-like domain containing protein [Kiritimatiellia bacterium]